MMRPMALANYPATPTIGAATVVGSGNKSTIQVAWSDNSFNESGFTIQRATAAAGPWTTIATGVPGAVVPAGAAPGFSTGPATYIDTTAVKGTTYYYRVIANNVVGYTQTYAPPAVGYPTVSADTASGASNAVVR